MRRSLTYLSVLCTVETQQLDIDSVVDRGVFEVEGQSSSYDLSLSIDVCPGVFWRTKQVKVCPRFVIVNCLDADVVLRQTGD